MEEKMSNNSSYDVFVVLVLLAVTTLIFGTAVTIAPAAPNAIGASDWYERHPEAVYLSRGADLSDYYQRHLGSLTTVDLAGASDWFERHPVAAPIAIGASDWFERHPATAPSNPARPRDYAALKDAQLERSDAAQFGKASAAAAIGEDSFYTMQKEQREMQKEQRAASDSAPSNSSPAVKAVRSERYDALKDAQLERDDARRIGSATFSTQVPALDRCRPHRDEVDC
jgi:hypothetical protein